MNSVSPISTRGSVWKPRLRSASGAALLLMVVGMYFIPGCSTSTISLGGSDPDNAKLKGSYTYSLGGSFFGLSNVNGFYKRAGTFVADGKGNRRLEPRPGQSAAAAKEGLRSLPVESGNDKAGRRLLT